MITSFASYPAVTEVEIVEKALQHLSQSLKLLLEGIVNNKDVVKFASIEQAIIQSNYTPHYPCFSTVDSGWVFSCITTLPHVF